MESEPGRSVGNGRLAPAPGVIETDLGGELVLLDPVTQQMFTLNASGRVIWQGLRDEPLDAIVARLVAEFEVDAEQATIEARLLVDDLVSAGLVRALPE